MEIRDTEIKLAPGYFIHKRTDGTLCLGTFNFSTGIISYIFAGVLDHNFRWCNIALLETVSATKSSLFVLDEITYSFTLEKGSDNGFRIILEIV